jgi:hypothetical protein
MKSFIRINKKLKISIAKLDKLLGNCDAVSVDAIFYPVMRDYQTVANQLIGLEALYNQQKESPNADQIQFIEESVALASSALTDIDEALIIAVDEHHASVI